MGLNLNYTPNRLVDITTLTEDQWLSWRRKGIGGSDVAVALNSSVEMSRNVQSGNTQNLKSPFVNQAACCACTHSRYFAGGSPSGLRV